MIGTELREEPSYYLEESSFAGGGRRSQRKELRVLEDKLSTILRLQAEPSSLEAAFSRDLPPDQAHWDVVLELAAQNKVAPLLYYTIKSCGAEGLIPEMIHSTLRSAYLANFYRNSLLYRNLLVVARVFEEKNIPLMPLKGGISLIEPIYKDRNVRMMSDIDILIPEDRLAAAKDLFLELGYLCVESRWGERDKMNFIKPPVDFEIHVRPFPGMCSPILSPEDMWHNARIVECEGIRMWIPSPTDQLFHCIFHEIIQHERIFDCCMSTMYEVCSLLRFYGSAVDLHEIAARANRFGLEKHLALYLLMVENRMGPILPTSLVESVRRDAEKILGKYLSMTNLPLWIDKAGQRYFYVKTRSGNLFDYARQLYRYYFRSTLHTPKKNLLEVYGFKELSSPLMVVLRTFHIIRLVSLHALIAILQPFLEARRH